MKRPILFPLLGAVFGLSACTDLPTPQVARLTEPDLTRTLQAAPPNARPGACYGRDVTPAVIESVTENVIVQPAQIASDGTVTAPAIYKQETRAEIVQEREEIWFETPCDFEKDPELITSLQRALTARNLYNGPITGMFDPRTRRAVRAYQKPQGLDSSILSLAAARKLGLVAIARPDQAGDQPATQTDSSDADA